MSAEELEVERQHVIDRDTAGGYVWGDPVILCTVKAESSLDLWHLVVAERVLAVAS